MGSRSSTCVSRAMGQAAATRLCVATHSNLHGCPTRQPTQRRRLPLPPIRCCGCRSCWHGIARTGRMHDYLPMAALPGGAAAAMREVPTWMCGTSCCCSRTRRTLRTRSSVSGVSSSSGVGRSHSFRWWYLCVCLPARQHACGWQVARQPRYACTSRGSAGGGPARGYGQGICTELCVRLCLICNQPGIAMLAARTTRQERVCHTHSQQAHRS